MLLTITHMGVESAWGWLAAGGGRGGGDFFFEHRRGEGPSKPPCCGVLLLGRECFRMLHPHETFAIRQVLQTLTARQQTADTILRPSFLPTLQLQWPKAAN